MAYRSQAQVLRHIVLTGWGILACTGVAWAEGGAAGGGGLAGQPAPPFVLPRIDGTEPVASDTLFETYGLTILAFWTTHCAECTRRMEVCQELQDWGELDGLHVVAVNFDDHPSAKMGLIARNAGPRLLHLYDPGGRMAAVYEAGSHSYSAFLVDWRGIVQAVHYEIMPDELWALRPTITGMLEAALSGETYTGAASAAGPPGQMPPAGRSGILEELGLVKQQKIELHGRGRIRWMDIDTTGTGAVGANGEPLVPGPTLRQRMELELTYRITPRLKAGGLIRLSNESDLVLRGGPDYFSSPWGSFLLRYDTRGRLPVLGPFETSLTGGYYRIHLTPLTMMRWDEDDTPVSGGQRAQGCGVCGGQAIGAGFIRTESLEKMGPDLTFEGAQVNATFMERFDLLALYARPQAPHPDTREACYTSDPETNYFHQDLYAGRLKGHFGVPWGAEPFEVAATAMYANENEDLPGCPNIYMHDRAYPIANRIVGADAMLPLPSFTSLFGEVVASSYNPNKYDASGCCGTNSLSGAGALAGLGTEFRAGPGGSLLGIPTKTLRARLEMAYLHMEPEFFSAYRALSYESNQKGYRLSLRADWGPAGLGLFYKRVLPIREVEPYAYARQREQLRTTGSVWLDAELWRGGVLMLGAVAEDNSVYVDDRDAVNPVDPVRLGPLEHTTLIASFDQEIAPNYSLQGELEWLDGNYSEGLSEGGQPREAIREYTSTIIRVMLDVEF